MAISIEPSQFGGSKPRLEIVQLTSPQSGFSNARHITPTTTGVISMGRTRMPRTIQAPLRPRLKNMARAVPSTTWIATADPTIRALFLVAFQNCGSARRSA
jgi:hypothetical protein